MTFEGEGDFVLLICESKGKQHLSVSNDNREVINLQINGIYYEVEAGPYIVATYFLVPNLRINLR